MGFNLVASYNRFINAVSFSRDFHRLRRQLNFKIDSPENIEEFPLSHPQGFIKEFKRRRISIVESYVSILNYLESEHHRERIHALKLLEEQTLHSKNLTMPINTARVQLALMKEAVKNRDNKRRQLELLQDFSISSYGHPTIIRKYLDELGIIELPEDGRRLAEMSMGWDNHVHDNSSYGRKNPSQLIIDAFIKGISRITVAFNLLSDRGNLEEMLEAGKILGIRVDLSVEFSVRGPGGRFHFMFLLPHLADREALVGYFESNKEHLKGFIAGLEQNQLNRVSAIGAMVENFNRIYLPLLNEGYAADSVYYLEPLELEDIDEIVSIQNMNRMHLGEFLYSKFKPVLLKRVLLAKTQFLNAAAQLRSREISEWDYNNIRTRYESLRESYVGLNPEVLRERYFSNLQLLEYVTVFEDLAAVIEPLKRTGGQIKIIHPLEHGIDNAYKVIFDNWRWIDRIEIYNMYDSIRRPVDDILRFTSFVNVLNSGNVEAIKPFLAGHEVEVDDEKLSEIVTGLARRKFIPVAGSDAAGRSSSIPGMGFIYRSQLEGKTAKRYLEHHFSLPEFVSRVIKNQGEFVDEMGGGEPDSILSMGKSSKFVPNKVGDEHDIQPIPLGRALRYLNPTLKSLIYMIIGFVIAYFAIGLSYAIVWFLITGIRNAIVDLIARRGSKIREWTLKSVDFRFMSHSLFWSGLSVPILAFVKNQFDFLWPFAVGTVLFNFAKFFAISFSNGIYLMAHNRIRGFQRSVILANFFRSILSWPIASLFAPLGDLAGIPSIVQAKFWSDFVGGIIEGSGKFSRSVRLTRRDLVEIISAFSGKEEEERYTCVLDLLHLFAREPRARNSLREILYGKEPLPARIAGIFSRKHVPPEPRCAEYTELVGWFTHKSNYQKLADFVISRYHQDYAVVLTRLVANQFNSMRDWLLSGRKFCTETATAANAASGGGASASDSEAKAEPHIVR